MRNNFTLQQREYDVDDRDASAINLVTPEQRSTPNQQEEDCKLESLELPDKT